MGKAITALAFDDALSFSEGLAAVAKDNLYGFINTAGELVIPYAYSNAHSFTEGLAPTSNSKGFWGYIDTKGNWVVTAMYDYCDNFTNGEARVIKNNKVFYIDKKNKVLHD